MTISATYYDGRTSARHAVHVLVGGSRVALRNADLSLDYDAAKLRYRGRIAGAPLAIDLPDGGLLLAPFDEIARALPVPRATDFAHRLERHAPLVVLSIAALAVGAWFAYRDGIPWLAGKAADRLPVSVEAEIAQRALPLMDSFMFAPTKLTAGQQAAVRARFSQLLAMEGGPPPRLELRDAPGIGANALAIPGGVIVVTDQLVKAMDDEDLVEAVLAHELGHLRHRHGTRRILQASMMGLLSAAVLGDVASVGTLASVAPAALLNGSYSRDLERDADTYAFELMRRAGLSPALFSKALVRLSVAHDGPRGAARSRYGYLASHPLTEERVEAAEAAALQSPAPHPSKENP